MNLVLLKESDEKNTIEPIKCPFCGDGLSLRKNLTGKYFYGPIGKEESKYPTLISDIIFLEKNKEDVLVWDIIIKKG